VRKVTVLDPARADAADGWDFYERQEAGVGNYFITRMEAAIDSLTVHHGIHPKRHGLFCLMVPRFNHAIFYRELQDETEVVAVLDLRRNPSWPRRQLRNR
jgi:plasmid stabilization system protein ParE